MENIKFRIFCAIIVVTMMYHDLFSKAMLEGASTIITDCVDKHVPEILKTVESVGDKVVEGSKVVGSEAAGKLGKSAVDAAAQLGVDAAKTFAAAGTPLVVIAGVYVAAHSVTQLYPIGKEIVSNICPSAEEKALAAIRLEDAQRKLQSLQTEKLFRQCLIDNRTNADRNSVGLPKVCEDLAATWDLLGGSSEVEYLTGRFNKISQNHA